MSNEVDLIDLYESVCEASSWDDAMGYVVKALGEVSGLLGWMQRLEDAGEFREPTLAVLRNYAKEAGWQVIENRASHRVTPNDELDALREENLRLKDNLEHYAKQLRDVPPPGTKERLAEALEKLQTETLRSHWLLKELDASRLEVRAVRLAQELAAAQVNAKNAKSALFAASRGDKGGPESTVLAADQNPEE